ncbi:MAG: DUF4190 domain-containing protein [Anaerolineales bacterium]|nr:DUF4190 domain-containing protein [Anaerolineales bacterium]
MEQNTPTNKHSIISLTLGILTVFFFCGSWMPIPFTSFICYPASFITGLLAVIYGTISLSVINRNNESGKPIAWAGIISGGMIFLCILCIVVLFASLFFFAPNTVQPFIDNYQL